VAILFLPAGLLAFFRGLFDLCGVQMAGYLVQYASIGVLSAAVFLRALMFRQLASVSAVKLTSACAFVALAGSSFALTVAKTGAWEGVLYLGVMAFWTFYLVSMGSGARVLGVVPLEKLLLVPLLANLTVGLLEHSGKVVMPGSSLYGEFIRPAGLMGSMQHYAITLAIAACFYLQVFLATKAPVYLVIAVAFMLGTMASLTRSGYLILGLCAAFLCAAEGIRALLRRKVLRVAWTVLLSSASAVLLAGSLVAKHLEPFWERATTMLHPGAPGNPERLAAWRTALEMWAESPLVLGDAVGVVTQSTGKVFRDAHTVNVESGVLQQLVNFGLLGALAFYVMLLLTLWEIHRRHKVLRGAVLAGILQSLVYMSIETVPYMFLLGLAPALSDRLRRLERGGQSG